MNKTPPGLSPRVFRQPQARALVDCDYLGKLDDESAAWARRFLQSHYAGFRNGVQPNELQRDSDRARYRNANDVHAYAQAGGALHPIEEWHAHAESPEDSIISALDERRAASLYANRRRRDIPAPSGD